MRAILHEGWVDQAEEVLRTILPGDFPASANIYVVPMAQLEERLHRTHAVGWTAPLLDLQLQRHLQECRRWQGRGFCCVVNGDELDSIDERHPQQPGELWTHAACVLHEALHFILAPSEAPEAMRATDAADLPPDLRDAAAPTFTPRESTAADARTHHGPAFLRLAVHAEHRIERAGWKVTPGTLGLLGEHLPACGWRAMVAALRDEVQRCESWPLRLIAATDPPAEFAGVFA